ncbi:hypothetical protein [Yinghuangia sp. ASG 101]|uniref:hypothetical protein n=1 Tax=Yinghuangia sp. ASG 101 TaxID=2896848 RepID=UPI003FCE1A8C
MARNTVADAYAALVAQGWLTARRGSGTRSRSGPPPRNRGAERPGMGGIHEPFPWVNLAYPPAPPPNPPRPPGRAEPRRGVKPVTHARPDPVRPVACNP